MEPAFGENITSEGVLETETLNGDVWRIGTAVVQVSQPRSPCFKVAARLAELADEWRVKTTSRSARAA